MQAGLIWGSCTGSLEATKLGDSQIRAESSLLYGYGVPVLLAELFFTCLLGLGLTGITRASFVVIPTHNCFLSYVTTIKVLI